MEYNASAHRRLGFERLDFCRQRRRFRSLRSGRNVCGERRNESDFSQTQQNGVRRAKITRRHSRDVPSWARNLRERRKRLAMAGLGTSSLEEVIYYNYGYTKLSLFSELNLKLISIYFSTASFTSPSFA